MASSAAAATRQHSASRLERPSSRDDECQPALPQKRQSSYHRQNSETGADRAPPPVDTAKQIAGGLQYPSFRRPPANTPVAPPGRVASTLPRVLMPADKQAEIHLASRHQWAFAPYFVTHTLGSGTYGVVCKAQDRGGLPVALKAIFADSESGGGLPVTALREIALLRQIHHPNVVKINSTFQSDARTWIIVLEYLATDLREYLNQLPRRQMPTRLIKKIGYYVLQGLVAIHGLHLLHRDIKPQNILLSTQGEVKIADFGLARSSYYGRELTSDVVTLWYRPPDILLGNKHYDASIDMWSFGCLLAELATGCPAFRGRDVDAQLSAIYSTLGMPPKTYTELPLWEEKKHLLDNCSRRNAVAVLAAGDALLANLLQQLLRYAPTTRLTAQQALEHAFFSHAEDYKHIKF